MKITTYMYCVRIYLLLPPTLSVISLKVVKKIISLPSNLVQTAIQKLIEKSVYVVETEIES